MTHSLHREGRPDSLEKDYVLFIYPARGFNYKRSAPKVRRLAELVFLSGPVGMMAKERSRSMNRTGKPDDTEVPVRIKIDGEQIPGAVLSAEQLKLEDIRSDGTRVYSIFDSRENLKAALKRIKEADEGISIMVSGLIDRVREIAAEIGIDPHMINLSLGIHGRTDRLPPADIREFTTMCGHGLVSPHLIKDTIRRVKTRKTGEWEGSLFIAEQCICGIYNPCRSAELLREKAPLYTVDRW
jgi:hypothetical protein